MDTIDILAWFFTILLALLIYRGYLLKPLKFWELQNVRTIKSFKYTSAKYLHELELQNYLRVGRIYGRYDGQIPVLTVADPDILKQILVKDFFIFPNRRDVRFGDDVMDKMVSALEGRDWKRVRSVLSSTFTSNKLKKMLDILNDCITSLSENLNETAQTNATINIYRLLECYSVDVIARCVFGTKINSHRDASNPFVKNAKELLRTGENWKSFVAVKFPQLMKIFKISLFNPESTQFFKNFVQTLLKKMEKNNNQNTFLKLVKDTQKSACFNENFQKEFPEKINEDMVMSEEELAAQCCIFFLAGFHATTSALATAIYSLAANPDIQSRLYNEIKDAHLNNNIDYDAINGMKYLDSVIAETFRKYPPTVRMERRAEFDYNINQIGVFIKKGMLISIPVYAMHHDPEWYPEPEKFNPERFVNKASLVRPYTYLPFGTGPRNCIGMRFAMLQIKLTLIHLLEKYEFKMCSKTKVPIELTADYGLLKPKDVFLKVKFRE